MPKRIVRQTDIEGNDGQQPVPLSAAEVTQTSVIQMPLKVFAEDVAISAICGRPLVFLAVGKVGVLDEVRDLLGAFGPQFSGVQWAEDFLREWADRSNRTVQVAEWSKPLTDSLADQRAVFDLSFPIPEKPALAFSEDLPLLHLRSLLWPAILQPVSSQT